jgi:hypothetical protein
LFAKALAQAGLGSDNDVQAAIMQIAKKHNVKFTSTAITLYLDNPRGALRDFKKSSMADLECFTKTIDRIEVDLEAMRARECLGHRRRRTDAQAQLSRSGVGLQFRSIK